MSSYTYIEHTDPFPSKKIKANKKTKTEILIASWEKLVKGLLENIYSTSRKYFKINSRKGSDNWSVLRHCRVLVYKVGKNGHAFNKLFCYSSMFLRSFIFKKCVAELIICCFTLLERSWGVFWWYSRPHLLLHMVPYWDDVMIPSCGPNMKNIIYLMILRPVTENYRWIFCVKWFFKRTPLLKNLPYKMISTNKN